MIEGLFRLFPAALGAFGVAVACAGPTTPHSLPPVAVPRPCPTAALAASASARPLEPPVQNVDPRRTQLPDSQNPDFHGRTTLTLTISDHQLEVFESDVAGDVALDGKIIMHGDLKGDGGEPEPWADLYRYFGPIPPFAGVVLLTWRGPGNLCGNHSHLTFVSVRDAGTWERANVPYCAGPDPIVTWAPGSITIRIPPHPPNRGAGVLPGETWVYRNGAVLQTRDR